MTELPLTLCTIGISTKLIDKFPSLLNTHDIQRDARHIMTEAKANRHPLTSFAKVDRKRITYPT
jgi:hypothetical protein